MKLVAVLHGYFGKCREILISHCFNHLGHPVGDNGLSPMLHTHVHNTIDENMSNVLQMHIISKIGSFLYADANIG